MEPWEVGKTVLETGLVGGWGLLLFLNSARRAGLLRGGQRRVPELAQGEIEWVVHDFPFKEVGKLPISIDVAYGQALFPRLAASSYRNLALSARSGFWCVFSVTTRRICGFVGSKSNLVWPALRYSRHLPFQVP